MQVKLKNIVKRYGGITAVNRVNLTIESGALHFLLGPSGCGKTTLLRILAGLESPSEGQIFFDHHDETTTPAASRGIGMVFQNYALWPHMTVLKNITYGLKLRKISPFEVDRRLAEVLSLTQLTKYTDRLPGQLSGGEQQRVALARALAIRPNVLLLDEPLSNLDAKLRHEMRDNISRIHRQTGITTVYVTHDQKEALSMGTSVSVMNSGSIIQTSNPRDLYRNPRSNFVAGFIGEMNVIAGVYQGLIGDDHLIHTELGPIISRRMFENLIPGQSAFLVIRPEAVILSQGDHAANENHVQMPLSSLTYLGETEQLIFSHDNLTMRVTVFNPGDRSLNIGDKATLQLPKSSTLILPMDPASVHEV